MFATIIMNSNKELQRTTTPTIYQQENNADEILVLVPQYYGNLNLRDCAVTLNWIQPSTSETEKLSGNIKKLEFKEALYKDIYLQSIVPITITETSMVGEIEIFLTIVSEKNNVDMKTGSTYLEIHPHKKISDYVPEETIELLSDYLIRMQQLSNTCNQVLELATEQANKATQSANLIIQLMQEWEERYGHD